MNFEVLIHVRGENDELVEVGVVLPIKPSGLLTVEVMERMKVLDLKKALPKLKCVIAN